MTSIATPSHAKYSTKAASSHVGSYTRIQVNTVVVGVSPTTSE